MKIHTKIVTAVLALLLISSCKNQTTEKSTHLPDVSSELRLNNGKKWVANAETHTGMKNLEALLNNVSDTTNYTALGTVMQNETTFIINNCTMEGDDHKQLHLVLVPILDGIDTVKKSKSKEVQKKNIAKIKNNLNAYFKHFETSIIAQ